MFTGLIEDVGAVVRAERRSDALVLTLEPHAFSAAELTLGESVAVDGVCLTVTALATASFTVLAGAETLACTTLSGVRPGAKVNLERAMRVGDRLGGHLVSGHVDVVGEVATRRDLGANLDLSFRVPRTQLRYVVEKGSVTIDGISLTVNRVDESTFAVALIPHTVVKTALAEKAVGAKVNIEVDVIGKYVEKLLGGYSS